jgi:hypothetical protein
LLPAAFENDDNSDTGGHTGNGDDGGADDADDAIVLDREAIKKATQALINARLKKGNNGSGGGSRRRKRGGKEKAGVEDEDADVSD